ncbi:MAG: arabinogalactan endo-1,4-beta-galactosidase [Anaerolineales bacterium]|nr:arabinogalactan endo-1,4-beta-galactosidase [Anaerolineales bacterium]
MEKTRILWIGTIIIVVLAIAIPVNSIRQKKLLPEVVNPDFESGITGWETTAGIVEEKKQGEGYQLSHYASDGIVETTQTLIDLPNGWVTLRASVFTTGIQESASIQLVNCGSANSSVNLPYARNMWINIVVSTKVQGGRCTIKLVSEIPEEGFVAFDDFSIIAGKAELSVRGADISSLYKSEVFGGVYNDENGTKQDALKILSDAGMNYARIRVWVNSPDGYHGKEEILEMAKRLKKEDMDLLVDFHYSDSWADPGKQNKPEAWREYSYEELQQTVYNHTYDICSSLIKQGTPPAMVQIGNEINNGMLWEDGRTTDWEKLAGLLKEGIRAVHECSDKTLVMLHIAEGGDNNLARWWFDAITEQGVDYDIIGLSYYPFWHGTLLDLQNNMDDMAQRYNKDIIVVEAAYPFTNQNDDSLSNIIISQITAGYPATPEGQYNMVYDIMNMVRAVPDGRGLGIFYWDATWTAVEGNSWDPGKPESGNAWENQALFDFNDRALPAMQLFSVPKLY